VTELLLLSLSYDGLWFRRVEGPFGLVNACECKRRGYDQGSTEMARSGTECGNSGFPLFAPIAADETFKAYQPVVDNLIEFNGKVLASYLEFSHEWTGFVMRRLQRDVALVYDLARCTKPSDALAIYSAYFAGALSDYQSEFTQLSTLHGKGFEQATRVARDTMDSIARTTPAAA
jgi:hypothetical protein